MTAPMIGVQGQLLDLHVVGCRNLRDKEWFSRQDPYVVIKYASSTFRTKTDTDGGKHPSFNDKFVIPLIEGLREIVVEVWNSNTITMDDFIGSGRIQLERALGTGYDDTACSLTSKHGKYAGELKVILHYAKPKHGHGCVPQHAPPPAYAPAPYGPPAHSHYPAAAPCQHQPAPYGPPPAYAQHQHQYDHQPSAPPAYGYGQPYYPAPAPYAPPPPPSAVYPPVYDAYHNAPYPPYGRSI